MTGIGQTGIGLLAFNSQQLESHKDINRNHSNFYRLNSNRYSYTKCTKQYNYVYTNYHIRYSDQIKPMYTVMKHNLHFNIYI